MNKTQKTALFNLLVSFLSLALLMLILTGLFWEIRPAVIPKGLSLAIFLVVILCLFWLQRKQSPREVEADERDKLIRLRAALAGYVSLLVALGVSAAVVQYYPKFGDVIPVNTAILVCVMLGLFSMAVYSAAVLIQYGREGKHADLPERQK
jgi:hypothetical protein